VGYARFFCFWSQWMDATIARIWQLATPLAHARGMEIIDIEFWREGGRAGKVLRLFLDKEGGAILDELSQVSRELSEVLDGEDIIDEAYTLEVSSPGINRPLKRPEHFARFIGKKIRVRTRDMINGRRSFLGRLLNVSTVNIALDQDGTRCEIPFEQIEKSNYEHDWSAPYAAGSQ
jgi:ribosome maturation factor RimP